MRKNLHNIFAVQKLTPRRNIMRISTLELGEGGNSYPRILMMIARGEVGVVRLWVVFSCRISSLGGWCWICASEGGHLVLL